jgi:transposase
MPGFRRKKAHVQASHPQHRIQAPSRKEYLAGETLHGLAKRHDICLNLIRVWVQKYEAGEFNEGAQTADLRQQYEARIAALERLVGKQALELEFLKGALKSAPRPKSGNTSVVVGPLGSASPRDAV